MSEQINNFIILESAEIDTDARIIKNAVIIQAGESSNRNDYPAEVLKRDGPGVFEGVRGYFGHVQSYHERTDPRNLAMTVQGVRFEEADSTLRCDLHYFADAEAQVVKAKEAYDKGLKGVLGLSIQASGRGKIVRKGTKVCRQIEALTRDANTSVDMVIGPAAGGRLFEGILPEEANDLEKLENLSLEELKTARPDLYEAAIKEAGSGATQEIKPREKSEAPIVDEAKITEALSAKVDERLKAIEQKADCRILLAESLRTANLPKELEAKVKSQFEGKIFEASALETEIASFKEIAAKMRPVKFSEGVVIGADSADKMQAAFDKAFGVEVADDSLRSVKPFRGLQEAYVLYTGDSDVTGTFRVSEAGINSGTFAYALGTSMYRRMIQDYRERDWGVEKVCTIGSAPNFKTQEEIKIPYLGDLDTNINPETQDYNEIQVFSDEEATYSIKQQGNVLSVTRKTIINDDLGALAKTAGRLGRAARRTVAQRVFVTMLEDNATYSVEGGSFFLSDTRTPAANYNLRASASSAISEDNIVYAIKKLEAMVEPGSGKPIGLSARPGDLVLIVPTNLKFAAVEINQANLSTAHNSLRGWFGANNEDIIDVPLLTNTTDYYVAWKPAVMEWIMLSFLKGQQEPELFLADNPLVGDMFMADKMKYKIRHEYEAAFLDCRGCYKTDSTA